MTDKPRNELRCTCSRSPLLATWGIDDKDRLFVHIRIYKQRRVYGEIYAYGPVKILCRECYRWYAVRIMQPNRPPVLEELPQDGEPFEVMISGQ